MGVDGGGGREKDKEKVKEKEREEEQDGMSVHSPCKAPPSSASSLPKVSVNSLSVSGILAAVSTLMLELAGYYTAYKVPTQVAHFMLWYTPSLCPLWSHGISAKKVCCASCLCFLITCPRFDRHFAPDEVLQLLDRFYNLDMLKPDDEEMEILNHEEDFCLPQSYFDKEES
ncbi:Chromatin modification-like protein [Citrus sinensis]|nr:Chromatin modification-like protein [Citrus sinensis]